MPVALELWELTVLGLVGIVAGWVNVMAGGGSTLTVPVMIFMGVPAPVANATNRIGIILQSVAAITRFFRGGFSDFRLSATLAIAASLGAIFGANLGAGLSGVWFNRLLAVVMVSVMILMSTGKHSHTPAFSERVAPKNLLPGHLLMVAAGFWGGMIQIGVGFILMPILHRVMGLDLVRVNMHKVFVVLVYTPIALAVFAQQVKVLWLAGTSLALGMMLGGWLGAHTTIIRGQAWIKRVLQIVLAVFVVRLIGYK